jgi:hypothetical protein
MAWSPARRSNAGRFEVEDPGDYAAFNSYQPGYGTSDGRQNQSSHSEISASITALVGAERESAFGV